MGLGGFRDVRAYVPEEKMLGNQDLIAVVTVAG